MALQKQLDTAAVLDLSTHGIYIDTLVLDSS